MRRGREGLCVCMSFLSSFKPTAGAVSLPAAAAEGGRLLSHPREFENAELLCGISPAGWKVWSGRGDGVRLNPDGQLDRRSSKGTKKPPSR